MNKIVYKKLKELANESKTIKYSELNEECGMGLDFNLAKDRAELGEILGEISRFENDQKRPMLSAIVISKDKLGPAFGFYNLADELGMRKKGETDQQLFFRQLNECFKVWKGLKNKKC